MRPKTLAVGIVISLVVHAAILLLPRFSSDNGRAEAGHIEVGVVYLTEPVSLSPRPLQPVMQAGAATSAPSSPPSPPPKQPSPVKPASAKPFPIPAPKPIATIPHQQSATPVQPTLSAQHPQAERPPSPQAVPRRTAPALHPTPTSPQMADILIEGLAGSSLTADLAQESRSTLTREDQPARSPRYHINPPPAYPALALKRRWQGEVWLRVLVGDQGEVIDVWVESSSGYSLLDDTAEKSVRGWKFHPAQNGTENASETVLLPIRFRLPQS